MPIKFNVKITSNSVLIKDLEALINKHKDTIENITTQYTEDRHLFEVKIQFHPVWVEMMEDNDDEEEEVVENNNNNEE